MLPRPVRSTLAAPAATCCGGSGFADYAAVPCPNPQCPVPIVSPASPGAPAPAEDACPRCYEGADTEDDEREHLRHVVTAVIENWLRIHLELCRAGIGDMNSEEIAQRKILDQVQYLALSGVDYSLAPHVVDAVLVALAARPPASSPPVEEHTEPDDDRPRCDARISPSWAEQWVRCGSLISGGRCDAFGHGPAAQPPVSSPGEPPTAGGVS